MADTATATTSSPLNVPLAYFRKQFPFLGEVGTALLGALGSEFIVNWIKMQGRKVVRTHFPHLDPNFYDEGVHSVLMESLNDGQKKGLERWLAKKTFQQRAHLVRSLVEMAKSVVPFDLSTAEGRELWVAEQSKAVAATVSYLKYLADLDDKGRDASVKARDFMKAKTEYPAPQELLARARTFIDELSNHPAIVALQASNDATQLRADQLVAELSAPMTWRERHSFFSLTGRRAQNTAPINWAATGARVAAAGTVAGNTATATGNYIITNRRQLLALTGAGLVAILIVLGVVYAVSRLF